MGIGAEHTDSSERLRLLPSERDLPPIAWPTVALTVGAWALLIASHAGLQASAISPATAVFIQALATYCQFTVVHDAVHGALATSESGCGWLNSVIGRLAAIPLLAPWVAFSHLHLQHHRHTNHPDEDPDNWSGSGPRWLLPVRWATQYYHYIALYFGRLQRRPFAEAAETLTLLITTYALIAAACASGHAAYTLKHVILPAQIAHTFLAFAFDYLPHRPHMAQGRYVDTVLTSLTAPASGPRRLFRALAWPLTLPLLWQNYHVIHHLVPWVPFYRYGLVFDAHVDELEARGTRALAVLPIVPPGPVRR